MKVTVTDLSDVEKEVLIEVPIEEMQSERATTLKEFQKKATVKGFRPGKAPFHVLEKLYAAQIDYELQSRLLEERTRAAFIEHGFVPLGQPVVEDIGFEKDKPFTVRLKVDIKPKLLFDDTHYKGLSLKRPALRASDEEVARELERLQESQAELEPILEDTPLATGLVAVIDFEGCIDGKSFKGGSGKNHAVELGKGRMLPEFEHGLLGLKVGDETQLELTFPVDYFAAELAGKSARFDIKVQGIKKKTLPGLDDEFAKDLGKESLAALKAEIATHIVAYKDRASRHDLYRQILDHVTEKIHCPVPRALVEREKAAHRHPEGEAETHSDAEIEADAAKRIKGDLILEEIARREACTVEPADLEARVREIAAANRQSPADVIAQYREKNLFPYLQFQMMAQKALDKIIDYATIEAM